MTSWHRNRDMSLAAEGVEVTPQSRGWLSVSPAHAWYSLCVLLLLFVCSYIDRSALSLFVDPIKRELGLIDTQFSLITGAAFALFYSSTAIPLAAWSDNNSRKWAIVAGVVVWGAMTAGCGVAGSFWTLFVLRMGVGLGEAALTPNAWALIPEIFPARLQGRAMALFVSGGVIGSGMALIAPSLISGPSQRLASVILPDLGLIVPWRSALVGLGILTIALAVPAMFLPGNRPAVRTTSAPWRGVVNCWARRRELSDLFIAGPLLNAVAVGTMSWLPAYFMRCRGWSISEAGYRVGGVLVLAGFVGTFASGWLADRLQLARDGARGLRVVGVTALLSLPCLLAMLLVRQPFAALAFAAASLSLSNFMSTLLPLAVQAKSVATQRAQTAAVFLLVANLVGFGLGPTLPALVGDYLFRRPDAIGWSMFVVAVCSTSLAAAFIFRSRRV